MVTVGRKFWKKIVTGIFTVLLLSSNMIASSVLTRTDVEASIWDILFPENSRVDELETKIEELETTILEIQQNPNQSSKSLLDRQKHISDL